MTPPTARKDSIDRFIDSSLALFPGVDPDTEAAVDRIHMLSKHIKRSTEGVVTRLGLNSVSRRISRCPRAIWPSCSICRQVR